MQMILRFSQYLQQIVCFISVEFCGTSSLAFNTVSLFISSQQVEKDSTFCFLPDFLGAKCIFANMNEVG